MTHDAVAFVPVRLNSKRVAGKSIRRLRGKTLLEICLRKLATLGIPVFVYCSDPESVLAAVGDDCGATFLKRPEWLDADCTLGIEIYREFEAAVPANKYMLVHCTSPFTLVKTYGEVLAALGEHGSSMTGRTHRTFCWYEQHPLNFTTPRIHTQDLSSVVTETSAAYAWLAGTLQLWGDRTTPWPKIVDVDLIESLDIDTEQDWNVALQLEQAQLPAHFGPAWDADWTPNLCDRERPQPIDGGP